MIKSIFRYIKTPDQVDFPRSHPYAHALEENVSRSSIFWGFLKNFHWLIVVFPVALWQLWPHIAPLENKLITFFLYLSFISNLFITINSYIIVLRYNRWLRSYRDKINLLLDNVAKHDMDKSIEMRTFILYGESRNFLLKYPAEYAEIRMPALWSSLFGTKLMFWYSFSIGFILAIVLMKISCSTPWSSIAKCF